MPDFPVSVNVNRIAAGIHYGHVRPYNLREMLLDQVGHLGAIGFRNYVVAILQIYRVAGPAAQQRLAGNTYAEIGGRAAELAHENFKSGGNFAGALRAQLA